MANIVEEWQLAQGRASDASQAAAMNGQGLKQTILQSMACNPSFNLHENEYAAVLQKYLNQGLNILEARDRAREEMRPIWQAAIDWEIARRRGRDTIWGIVILALLFATYVLPHL